MTTVFDIPAELFIRKIALELREKPEIQAPSWAEFVKTGVHKEMPPENTDWWHIRAAAVLRRVYVDGPVGVERMRTVYGGPQNRGSRQSRFRKGSGSIARKIFQQLEAAGLLEKVPGAARSPRQAVHSWIIQLTSSKLKLPQPPRNSGSIEVTCTWRMTS